MEKFKLVLFVLITGLVIGGCQKKDKASTDGLLDSEKKKEYVLYTYTSNPGVTINDALNNSLLISGRTTNTCNVAYYPNTMSVSYDPNTLKYFLNINTWIIAYNFVNQIAPSSVCLSYKGVLHYPINPQPSIPQPSGPHVGFEYNYKIDLGTSCPITEISDIDLYYHSMVSNCSQSGTATYFGQGRYDYNLSPNPCGANISYTPGHMANGFKIIQFRRDICLCGSCLDRPSPPIMTYEYRIVGSTNWSLVTSTTAPDYKVNTPQLAPGDYEYRCRAQCGTQYGNYSVIQPGVNQFTIQ